MYNFSFLTKYNKTLKTPKTEYLTFTREFPLFLGDTLVSCLFRVTNWFLSGERFLPLVKTSTASCLFKITTNQLLHGKRFFLGLEKETDSIPFS